jgi:hypothetical protein
MFTDTAGTTPATVGSAVALMLDKSKGLVLGPELVPALNFTAGWFGIGGFVSATSDSFTTSGAGGVYLNNILEANKGYEIAITGTSGASFSLRQADNGGGNSVDVSTSGFGTFRFVATRTALYLRNAGAGTTTISGISVRELPGFHATQATAAARPILGRVPSGGRRNLLERTEEFDNAYWTKTLGTVAANTTTAPDGTATADTFTETALSGPHDVRRSFSAVSGQSYTFSCYVKAKDRTQVVLGTFPSPNWAGKFDLSAGTYLGAAPSFVAPTSGAILDVGNGWYRCSVTFTATATGTRTVFLGPSIDGSNNAYVGDGTSGIFIWGAQLELGSTATAYQRVTSTFDVTEAGQPDNYYLSFDGVDDSMVTPTITPGIDKVQVFAGVRKLSDAALGLIVSCRDGEINLSGFSVFAPRTISTGDYAFRSRGTSNNADATTSNIYPAPRNNVLTGIGQIANSVSEIRVNGSLAASSALVQGSGNYPNQPISIGARATGTLFFNGQLFSLIVRFGANLTNDQIVNTEKWVSGKTAGVTL